MTKKVDIAELLLAEKLIDESGISQAAEEVKKTGLTLERAVVKLGMVTDEDIVRVKAASLGLPYLDLADYVVDEQVIRLIPEGLARKFRALPLFKIANRVTVGMVDPQDILALDQIRRITKTDMVTPVLVAEKGIQRILDQCYHSHASMTEIVKSITLDSQQATTARPSGEIAEDAPVIRLVNVLIAQAVRDRASDIHIEPEENLVRVRCRIDGLLHEIAILPKKLQNALISRVKVLSHLDIAESRKPQDGRIRMKVEHKDVDIRVSFFPTVHGENIVLRILDKAAVLLGLKEIGFSQNEFEIFNKIIQRPNGIILVTGPTGSGKTSTLYAALTTISSMQKNIITIEDPVEYELPIIRQTQINVKAGITFAEGLRSILRQDPDIIMVGEIRDRETAEVAIQAALTGHLVFSTLHTNDAPSALTRLLDMGIEPFLISSSVIGIVAQRLVRLNCEKCRQVFDPPPEVRKELGLSDQDVVYRGQGCPQCRGTGFAGRTGIFEVLLVKEDIRRMIDARVSADEIKRCAMGKGMKTLRDDGLLKVRAGLTTPQEILRVTENDR